MTKDKEGNYHWSTADAWAMKLLNKELLTDKDLSFLHAKYDKLSKPIVPEVGRLANCIIVEDVE